MNKLNSFVVSAAVAGGLVVVFAKSVGMTLQQILTPALIYWYMMWKLLHDKRKD